MFPYPLGPITDDAQAHLLFRNQTSLFDLFEGLPELRLILYLMPAQQMDDAITIEEVEAKALRIALLAALQRTAGCHATSGATRRAVRHISYQRQPAVVPPMVSEAPLRLLAWPQ